MSDKCPVCNLDLIKEPQHYDHKGSFIFHYRCKKCGDFFVQSSIKSILPAILENKQNRAVLSHWIRTKHEQILKSPQDDQFFREEIILDRQLVENIIKRPPPSPSEQANNIIRWLGENIEAPGEILKLEYDKYQSIMGAITLSNFALVIRHLIDSGIMQGNLSTNTANVTLSFEGLQYYEELKQGINDSRKTFMAMQYGDEQLDKIVEEVFKPAVKQTGFDLFRLIDKPQPAGLIDDRLRVEIQTSRFLIADLTHENAGAYWEAGYAEGLVK